MPFSSFPSLSSSVPPIREALDETARLAPPSGIAEVHARALRRADVVKFWVGEGNLPTPDFIREAAVRSLADGETFYTHQGGIPELRRALVDYHARHFGTIGGRPFDPSRFLVTSSGMHAIVMAITMVAGAGDEVLVPTPAWPNAAAAAGVRGVGVREVPMRFTATGWRLDADLLAASIGPRTRAILINSPGNPTGWVAGEDELAAVVDLARRHGLWIVADEVYGRFCYLEGRTVAPSLHQLVDADEKVIFVNTFSKNWAMTGWRIGWIEVPPVLADVVENLIQYSSSGTPVFIQRAAVAALDGGEDFIAFQRERARGNRDLLVAALGAIPGVRLVPPDGAFYLFFSVGEDVDTRTLCLDMVDEAGVGLAPGTAFGKGGASFMRLCYAGDPAEVAKGSERIVRWLAARGPADA